MLRHFVRVQLQSVIEAANSKLLPHSSIHTIWLIAGEIWPPPPFFNPTGIDLRPPCAPFETNPFIPKDTMILTILVETADDSETLGSCLSEEEAETIYGTMLLLFRSMVRS